MWHNENLHEYQLTPSQIGLCIYQKCPAWCLDHIKWYRNVCSSLLCFLSLLKHFAQKFRYQIKTKDRSPLSEVDGGGGGKKGGVGWTHFLQAYWCVHSYVLKEEKKKGLPRRLSDKESACQCRRCRFDPWSRKTPHIAEQLSPGATATEVWAPWSPCSAKRRSHCSKPAHGNYRGRCSLLPGRSLYGNEDPGQPEVKKEKKTSFT